MRLNIARDNTPQRPDEVVYLTRVGAPDSVGNTDTVDADLVDGTVNGEQVDEFGPEGVFRGESDLDALGLDEFDNLNGADV